MIYRFKHCGDGVWPCLPGLTKDGFGDRSQECVFLDGHLIEIGWHSNSGEPDRVSTGDVATSGIAPVRRPAHMGSKLVCHS